MPRDLTIADRIRAKGVIVVEVNGWKSSGSDYFDPEIPVAHHTAGASTGDAPSLGICISGTSKTPGPLCNVLQSRSNKAYVISAGRTNNAGSGGWKGRTGNSKTWGIEVENVGTANEPWREDQLKTTALIAAALAEVKHKDSELICEHKEWAPTRKIDRHTIQGHDLRIRVNDVWNPPPASPKLELFKTSIYENDDPDGRGYILDGWGGIHAVNGAVRVTNGPYWPGWDIARDIAIMDWNLGKGYLLDGFGGIHTLNGAPQVALPAYWGGWDIARSIDVSSDGRGKVFDGYGGQHRFGGATTTEGPYWG